MLKTFATLAFALCSLAILTSPSAGTILAEQTDLDLGLVYRDEPQEMAFPIRNVSRDSLHILTLEPSCDCTTARVEPGVVPPDATAEVCIFFDPMGYEGRGKVTESVKMITSDPKTPEVLFTFAIEVLVGPEPEPRSLAFGVIAKGSADTVEVTVRPGKSAPLRVTGVRAGDSRISVTRAGRTAEGAEQLSVSVGNASGGGQLASFITIETSDTLKPEIRVPVTASLVGNIALEPDVVAFGPTLPGKAIAQTLRVYSPVGLAFKVASVTSAIAQLEFEVAPAERGYSIVIKVKDGAAAGRVTGEIAVTTDRPGEPPLTAKVTGHVRSVK
jgi:hypothetical protein